MEKDIKRLQKLAGIVTEDFEEVSTVLDDHPKLKNKIQQDGAKESGQYSQDRYSNPGRNKIIYDFGGSEGPLSGKNVTVIDIEPNDFGDDPNFMGDDDGNKLKYIQHDLLKPIKLPPADFIQCTDMVINAVSSSSDIKAIMSNVDDNLKSGGLFRIHDTLENVETIAISILNNYKIIEYDYEEGSDMMLLVLKK